MSVTNLKQLQDDSIALINANEYPDYSITIPSQALDIVPMGKPRMNRSCAWNPSDAVLKYWDYKDRLKFIFQTNNYVIPVPYLLAFYLPMPKSWSKKRKAREKGTAHLVKPDKDNLEKAFLDALLKNDSAVHDGRVIKYWWDEPIIILKSLPSINADYLLETFN